MVKCEEMQTAHQWPDAATATFTMIESASQVALLHGDLYSKRDGYLLDEVMG